MRKHWSLALCLSLFMIFGLAGGVLAQTDSDGDLNADITDPFPTDPTQGGVYVGGTITYNVLLSGDLDAGAFTGTVITITADGVTFDGNGHKIIAPNAGVVISLNGRSGVTVKNVTVAGNAASPSGEGILLVHSSNNTITNSTASHRVNGIRLTGRSNGNVVSDNLIQRTNSGGIALNVELTVGEAGGNQLLNNDVQGYSTGIAISRDNNFVLSGNTFGNNTIGIQFVNVSNRVISNLVFPTTVDNPIRLNNVTGFTIDNVTVAGNAASPSGEGILLIHSSNNTITNSTASNRVNGIRLTGRSNGNVVSDNLIQRTNSGGIALNVELTVGEAGGNQLLNNDVQGYSTGIAISRDNNFVLSGNTFGNNTIGIQLMNVSNRAVSNLVFPTTVGNPMRLDNVTGFTFDNVTVAGDPATRTGTGFYLNASSNNTIKNSNASDRGIGILVVGASNGNVISDNNIRNTSNGSHAGYAGAIIVTIPSTAAGGNKLLNNDVQGSVNGITIVGDSQFEISGNIFGNNTTGLTLWSVSNRTISGLVFPATVGNPIYLVNVTNFTFDNINVAGDPATRTGTGFFLNASSNNTIKNSNASDRGIGILVVGASNGNVISDNSIRNTSNGSFAGYAGAIIVTIPSAEAGGNKLLNNDVQGSVNGITIVGDSQFEISGNIFGNNTTALTLWSVANRTISDLVFPTTVGNPIYLVNVTNFTFDNINVAGDPATRTGTGFFLNASSNNTIKNSNASDRGIGILVVGASNGNVISDNNIRNTSNGSHAGYAGAIIVTIPSADAGGNKLLNNDVQGSVNGITIVGDSQFEISGNIFGNNTTGLTLWSVSNRTISGLAFPATVGNPIYLVNVTNFTFDNVNVAGDPATRTGTGFFLNASSNNTIKNSNASDRGIGILVVGASNGNVISNNSIRNTSNGSFAGYAGAIIVTIPSADAGGNKLLNNDVQGSVNGITIVGDSQFEISGNIFGNNTNGIMLFDVSNRTVSNLNFPATVTNPIRLTRATGLTLDNVAVTGNPSARIGTGIFLNNSSSNTITNSDVSNKLTGIQISNVSNNNVVTHNNIFGNGKNIFSDQAIELSLNGEGNYWGRSCPGPLFVPGTDSNLPNVVDSFPYGTYDGWLGGGIPGCTTANAGQDEEICAGASTTIGGNPTASGGTAPYTYQWTPSAGLNNATIANPITSPASTTEYTVEVTGANGAKATDKVIVTVNPLPTANAGADQKIAYGQTVRLGGNPTASGGNGSYTYSWTPNTGLLDPATVANPRVRPLITTTYTVTVKDVKGCEVTDQVTIITHNFVFLSNGLVKINQNEDSKGDIHANGKIEFGKGKPGTHLGNLAAVDDIKIEDKNTIQGNALAGDELYLLGNAKVTGTKTAHAAVATIPLPSLSYSAGGPNVTVAANTSKTLAPGSYGTVDLRTKATLLLSAGDYYMNILSTDPNAILSINATGPINIHVVSDLEFDNNVQVKLTGGTSDNVLFTSLQTHKIDMGVNVIIYGTIINPNAEVHFGNNSKLKGAVFAASITLDPMVKFYHHTSPGTFPKESEVAESEVTSPAEAGEQVTSYQLEQNYPNPFNPTTMIQFAVPRESQVRLTVYNLLGQEVAKLVNQHLTPGTYKINWDAGHLASGVYIYRLETAGVAQTKRMFLMK